MDGSPTFTNFAEKTNIVEMSRLGVCFAMVLMIGLTITEARAQEQLLLKKGTTPKTGVTAKGITPRTPTRSQAVSLNWVKFESAVIVNGQ